MSYFIFEFLEKNRNIFDGMDYDTFVQDFEVTDYLADEFVDYARLEEAQIDISSYLDELKQALKANIAQQLFGPNAYEQILNTGDPMLEKILEIEGFLTEQ